MSGWMIILESRIRLWAAGHANRTDVLDAARAALREGAPTADVLGYLQRRIAHWSVQA
mgnify:CR=1 FL=1